MDELTASNTILRRVGGCFSTLRGLERAFESCSVEIDRRLHKCLQLEVVEWVWLVFDRLDDEL